MKRKISCGGAWILFRKWLKMGKQWYIIRKAVFFEERK
jgi:hypothetical protein